MSKPGDRVGVILSSQDGFVNFLGNGVYEGDYPCSDVPSFEGMFPAHASLNAVDLQDRRNVYAIVCRLLTKPRILLDNGRYVWGSECSFGPVDKIKSIYLDTATTIQHVVIERDHNGMPTEIMVVALEKKSERIDKERVLC